MTYSPETHDPIVMRLHAAGHILTDIARLMAQTGQPVAREDIGVALKRLGLVPNKKSGKGLAWEESRKASEDRPTPFALAKYRLGVEERNGRYWLGMIPVSVDDIMRRYNRSRVRDGLEQVGIEKWRHYEKT